MSEGVCLLVSVAMIVCVAVCCDRLICVFVNPLAAADGDQGSAESSSEGDYSDDYDDAYHSEEEEAQSPSKSNTPKDTKSVVVHSPAPTPET